MTAIRTTTSSPTIRVVAVAAGGGPRGPPPAPQWGTSLGRLLPGRLSPAPAADRLTTPRIPPAFEANLGQFNPDVAFVARAPGHDLFLTPTEAVVSLAGTPGTKSKPAVVRIRPVGGRAVPAGELVGGRRKPGVTNYLTGNDPAKWQRNVPRYGAVTYPAVYPGIDLVYHSGAKGLEYDYVVAPGADPSVIALEVEGATRLRVGRNGDLVADTPAGPFRQAKPVVYQHKGSQREPVEGAWVLAGAGRARFNLGPYDTTRQLVIDPVLVYSSYLGGSGTQFGHGSGNDGVVGVAVDGRGGAYLVGTTSSPDFPTTTGAFEEDFPGLSGFVAKVSADGASLAWATYLAGVRFVEGQAIAVTADGAAYVSGLAVGPDAPVTDNTDCGECYDEAPTAYAARLAPGGDKLSWASFLGPAPSARGLNGERRSTGVAVDASGSAYVTGAARLGFATTPVALEPSCNECDDPGFVAKLTFDQASSTMVKDYVTYLDGAGAGIAVDGAGGAIAAGARGGDAYVAALTPDGAGLAWETTLGGSGDDRAASVARGPGGRVVIAGTTASPDFPATSDAFGPRCAGATASACGGDAFVAALGTATGVRWEWASHLGGTGADAAAAVAVGGDGGLWVAGTTTSSDFPLVNPVQDTRGGSEAAFLARVAPDGTALLDSTYLGGSRSASNVPVATAARGLAVGAAGAAYVGGITSAADHPIVGAFQDSFYGGLTDGFVTKVAPLADADLPLVVAVSPRSGRTSGGTAVTVRGERLAGATGVDFGATRVACPSTPGCVVVSASEIRAVTPPGPRGEAVVRVTTGAGTAALTSPPSPLARFVYTAGSWSPTLQPTGAEHRIRGVAALLPNGKVLVAGGCGGQGTRTAGATGREDCDTEGDGLASAQLFDPLTGMWSDTAAMGFARQFDWGAKIFGPSAMLLSGGATRCGADCGKVLVVGGNSLGTPGGHTPEEDLAAELYNPTLGIWEPLPPALPDHGTATAVMLDNGKVLFVGGTEKYVSEEEGVPECRPNDIACLRGGYGWTHPENRPQVYDPLTRTWASAAPSGYRMDAAAATRLPDGKVLVTGAWSSQQMSPARLGELCAVGDGCPAPAQVFDPGPGGAPGSWSPAGPAGGFPAGAATLLAGPAEACGPSCGKVLVTGGSPDVLMEIVVGDAELYDPARAGTPLAWSAPDAMVGPTRMHQSVLLPDGTVLVAGGQHRHARSASSLFDPARGEWVEAGDPLAPRGGQSLRAGVSGDRAVLLSSNPTRFEADAAVCGGNCGRVLVVGGNDTDAEGDPIGPTAELYTPSPLVRSLSAATAPVAGGATITIHGTGFTNVATGERPKVSFGGVEASDVKVLSYDTLTAAVPAAVDRATVDITVTTDGGRSETGPATRFSYTGLPGVVRNVVAAATSESSVTVSFDAAGAVADTAPAATDYQVRFSRSPIADVAAFDAARALSHDPFLPGSVGQRLSLDVGGLRAGTAYYFAVRALGPAGEVGPVSEQASATTLGTVPTEDLAEDAVDQAAACTGVPAPGAGQVSFPGMRYSLVGGPQGTVVGAGSSLYSWFDLGARGEYAMAPGDAGLQAGRGYWAWFACPKLADLAPGQDSVAFGLGAYRASMVANPSGTSPATATGHDFAARWDPEGNGGSGAYEISGYRTPQRLAVGEGAWVFSYAPTQIHIRASG